MTTRGTKEQPDFGPPLWSIGMVVAFMIVVPMLLYSMAPAGPIREGDTIFSSGQTHVSLAHPHLYEKMNYEGSCLLDPQSPLIVLQRPQDQPDAAILAQVQGASSAEWPFCPAMAEVVVTRQQIVQKTDPFGELQAGLTNLFGR